MSRGSYKDRDALSFEEEGTHSSGRGNVYIGKRKRNSKGPEIVFDQDQHREYVTGFHKRKLERRNQAKLEKAEKERKQRLEDKAERRAKIREELDLERYDTPPESEAEEPHTGRGVRVYQSSDALTTVTVAPLVLYSDEDVEVAKSDDDVKISSQDEPYKKLTIEVPAQCAAVISPRTKRQRSSKTDREKGSKKIGTKMKRRKMSSSK